MKAAFINDPGPADAIQYGDLPDPVPGPDQCLVRVQAVSVNPVDTYIRAGTIPMSLPKPFIVGCDLCGTVEAVGAGVRKFKAGDRVWGSNQGLLGRQGTFSELAAVPEKWLYPVPKEASEEEMAALALVAITAHLGLRREARLQLGDTLFVHGGSGGVGSAVTQMAKAIGARVITTAGSDEKAQECKRLGADEVILYKTENADQRLKELAPNGIQVWWETLREPDFERMVPLMAQRGRILVMAGRDAKPVFPVGPFYVKDLSVHGFVMFMATPEEQQQAAEEINGWVKEKKLRPVIGRRMKLSETAQAHRLQEENTISNSGTLKGKIVLTP